MLFRSAMAMDGGFGYVGLMEEERGERDGGV